MGTLVYENNKFVFRGTYAEKDLPKQARFRWEPTAKYWWTDDQRKAASLSRFAQGEARDRLASYVTQTVAVIEASRATDADINLPVPDGLQYLPYQKAGIAYALEREGTLIADEMGLGKTIQGIGIANATGAERVLVICPASLRLNWQREFAKWSVKPLRIGIVMGDDWPTNCQVVVCNYDVVERHRDKIDAIDWDILLVDESHYLKNPKARRTAAVLGGAVPAAKQRTTGKRAA